MTRPAQRRDPETTRAAYKLVEVARLLGVSTMTVHRMLERGALRAILIPGSKRMVDAQSLEKHLKAPRPQRQL